MILPNSFSGRRKWWLAAAGLATLVWTFSAGTAPASGDYSAPKVYALTQADTDNTVPFLAPTNDNRVTLLLLMADAGLTRPRLPAPLDGASKTDPYIGQTPLDLDTFVAVFNDRPAAESSEFVEGEGDRCRSNAAGGDAYLSALKASNVPAAEQTLLADARKALMSACNSKGALNVPVASIKSAQGKDFATYLFAAADFYYGDFVNARRGFAGLAQSRQPWLKEAARYMTARVDLNTAQAKAFDEYGWLQFKDVDVTALAAAENGFRAYMKDYPRGAYVPSARGLLRRVAWLGGDHAKLADAFGEAFALTDPAARNVSAVKLAYEADNKLLGDAKPSDIHEPRLLAARDLMLMRRSPGQPAPLSRADLEAQRAVFAGQKELYDYLLAAYAFYDEDNPAAALKILGAKTAGPRMSYVQFSQQVLKGLALEATQKGAARTHWLALIPLAEPIVQRPAIELALAENYERAGDLAAVFAPGSAIRTPTYREILLSNSAGPDLLRQRAKAGDAPDHERKLALYVLLYKELTRGRYQAFLDDLRLMPANLPADAVYDKLGIETGNAPALVDFTWAGSTARDGFACPSIKAVATALSAKPHDERSLMCLGEFLRTYGYDNVMRDDHPAPAPDVAAPLPELSSTAHQFPGTGLSRLDVYKAIIANPKADSEVRAYALYRAVNCWAPSAYNSCDSSDAPKSQRKQWFQELKTRYPKTAWAQSLKYYW